jgi:prophage DNA circulation protein
MSWKDRLRPGITLASPLGASFSAKWRGDDITFQKRVNRAAHPDQDGDSSQDLGLNSPDTPLTFFFDGPDHDTEALRFSRALAERGVWRVTHPVYGLMLLQPVKITLRVLPVDSCNVTMVLGEWFQPIPDASAVAAAGVPFPSVFSAASGAAGAPASRYRPAAASRSALASSAGRVSDPAAAVEAAVEALSDAALSDAAQITPKAAASAVAAQSASWQIRKGLDAVKTILRSANARITAIMGTINDLTMQPYLDIAAVSGAVIQLAESPGLVLGSVAARVSMFVRLGRRIITDLPAAVGFSAARAAAALTGELWINAVTAGLGKTVTGGRPETRAEALSALSQYRAFAAESRDALDALSKASAASPIEAQYFPRASSAEAVLTLNAAVARYIMGIAFDLKTEKRITLERPTSPLLLAVKEYNCPASEADYYFDLLRRSNNLHGKELLLLDRQREIVIYV